MKKNDNKSAAGWNDIELLLSENIGSSYKIACIEAEKLFKKTIGGLGYSTKNMEQFLLLFGWKINDLDSLKKAIKKTYEIKETYGDQLISFEAEDIVVAFKQATEDLSTKKSLSFQKRLGIFGQNYLSFKSSFFKKFVIYFLGFFLVVKLLASTEFGSSTVSFTIKMANFIYSWTLLLAVVGIGLSAFIFSFFMVFEKKNIKIKDEE